MKQISASKKKSATGKHTRRKPTVNVSDSILMYIIQICSFLYPSCFLHVYHVSKFIPDKSSFRYYVTNAILFWWWGEINSVFKFHKENNVLCQEMSRVGFILLFDKADVCLLWGVLFG